MNLNICRKCNCALYFEYRRGEKYLIGDPCTTNVKYKDEPDYFFKCRCSNPIHFPNATTYSLDKKKMKWYKVYTQDKDEFKIFRTWRINRIIKKMKIYDKSCPFYLEHWMDEQRKEAKNE